MNNIRISAISYLNTLPFLYGMHRSAYLSQHSTISLDIPSVCAEKLLSGEADIGIIPVAILPELKKYQIISDYCIGAVNNVRSVLLLSERPIHEINKIILDYHSRSSIALMRIIAEKHWEIAPKWVQGTPGFEKDIKGTTAGVVIGDRAMLLENKYIYSYDLAGVWKEMTGMPFVFACWVAVSKISDQFLTAFNIALADGLSHIDKVIAEEEKNGGKNISCLADYFTKNVSYNLDNDKRKAMNLFLDMIKKL